jgi:hypothetical protein
MSADQSFDAFQGGLVVATGGGGFSDPIGQLYNIGAAYVANPLGALILVLCLLVFAFFAGLIGWSTGYRSGYVVSGTGSNNLSFMSSPSDNLKVSGFQDSGRHAADRYAQMKSGFMNSRETPYFPDVTNRVLRMENREKEAMRALGKINQERLRRASEDTSSTTPLPWGTFWSEWKKTHPMDGEQEGFRGGMGDLMPNY